MIRGRCVECTLVMLGRALTKMSSAMAVALVSFSSAIVINGSSAAFGAAGFWGRSRNGLLERGFVVVDDADADSGAGSSKGEAGLFGSGEPARLRKGLLLEKSRVKPGEG